MERYIKFLRNLKIRNRIALFLLFGLLISSGLIFQVSKTFAQSMIRKHIHDYIDLTQREISTSVELMIDDINMLAVRLLINEDIYTLFGESDKSYEEKRTRLRKILDELNVHKDIVGDITIITHEYELYSYISNQREMEGEDELYIRQIDQKPIPVWGPIKKDKNNQSYILLGRKYRNFYTGQYLGYLIINIREDAICHIYSKMVPDWGYSFILANDRYVISHFDKDKVGNNIFDASIFQSARKYEQKSIQYEGQPVIFAMGKFSERLENIGIHWKIISIISEKKVFAAIDILGHYILILQAIIFLAAIVLTLYLSINITRPVSRLRDKLNVFGRGEQVFEAVEYTRDEIGDLEKTYYDLITRIKELIQKNNEEKEKQREMELIALQAQINPHFVYNTLDAIGWIAKIKKQQDIEKMVIALATFFRISLHRGEKIITVEEEIQLVQSFITVEQLRFPDKFDVEYNIPDEIKGYKILKIILQPLVENAIIHGVSQKRTRGRITVTGFRVRDELDFVVTDDGVGFNPEAMHANESRNPFKGSGYGMKNVDERIKLEYGSGFGLQVESKPGEGTVACIRVGMKNIIPD